MYSIYVKSVFNSYFWYETHGTYVIYKRPSLRTTGVRAEPYTTLLQSGSVCPDRMPDLPRETVWTPVEVPLSGNRDFENPYTDVRVSATFGHEDGVVQEILEFWVG